MDNKNVYYFLVILRFVSVFLTFGYLHTDEYLQSPEIVAGDVFNLEVERSWEFQSSQPNTPCRSMVGPLLVNLLPFGLLKLLSSVSAGFLSTYLMVIFPRLVLFAASLLVDYTAYVLSGSQQSVLVTVASSAAMLTFMIRPFSNTLETLLLCLLLLLIFDERFKSCHTLEGILISIGVFNRFTFAFYAVPLIAYGFYKIRKSKLEVSAKIVSLSLGFFLTSFLIVLFDSIYFGQLIVKFGTDRFAWSKLFQPSFWTSAISGLSQFSVGGTVVVAPLNNLRYNMNPLNLAKHGLHPRWYHVGINLPLLLGPMFAAAIIPLSNQLDDFLAQYLGMDKKKGGKVAPRPVRKQQSPIERETYWALVIVTIFNIACLSLAQHQEVRFVLPNLILLSLLAHKDLFGPSAPKWVQGLTLAHGLMFFVVMGVAHQGGMVPALSHVRGGPASTHHVIFYGTYQPPRHLLLIKDQVDSTVVYDLKGEETSQLIDIRKTVLRIKENPKFDEQRDKILLLTPASFDFEVRKLGGWQYETRFWPHLSTDIAGDDSAWDPTLWKLNLYTNVGREDQQQ